ncbi:uridine diphosphate-N-acetylglucosamine-binding protein YvcK [Phycicoccus sp. M110.8]|uniref:gluconeogenesis factor YvcK family protein n=1 Tax=Phycicoccus sp. M110.8 TaxID=3075433 RepID=UPI0028FD52B1|nr:uridine diphosphate-N-acetylglucosamine-binding protein YvcK [Phycicoccus sp. M110.8]MDU0315836.1 uridine diphosphate-N-acetylglucosamine-binding protein YvcK [Phycicoccus sp. M110.8]
MSGPAVVALGGGHGLAASLEALKLVTDDITAVVTVADNGGSSGRLREEFGVLPPGDLRMAVTALCDDTEWGHIWRDVLQHRFQGTGPLAGHALGNLLITALWDLHDDPVTGLDLVGRLLNARGRVLPMAAVPLEITAQVAGLEPAADRAGVGTDGIPTEPGAGTATEVVTTVRGQVAVARTRGTVRSIALEPADPPAAPATVEAVLDADWVILGPGSWFTSVMPHLMVPALREALHDTTARRCLTLNLEHSGETAGISAAGQLEVLADHAPRMRFDVVLADPGAVDDEEGLRATAGRLGAELVLAPVARRGAPGQHDSLRLAAAYRDVFGSRGMA